MSLQLGLESIFYQHNSIVLVFCGSFSPITYLHLRSLELAREAVLQKSNCTVHGAILSPVSDYYKKTGLIDSAHRVEMCKIATSIGRNVCGVCSVLSGLEETDIQLMNFSAICRKHWLFVSDWEASRDTYSTTIELLQYVEDQLKAQNIRPVLLCGADLLESFNKPNEWKREDIEKIVKNYGIVVVERIGSGISDSVYRNDVLYEFQRNILSVAQYIPNDVSSTRIRLNIKRGLSVRYLIPDEVIEYIEQKKLFKDQRIESEKDNYRIGLGVKKVELSSVSRSTENISPGLIQ